MRASEGNTTDRVGSGARQPDLDRLRQMLQDHMVKQGLRSTEQRRLIIDRFFEERRHITIDDLLALVKAEDARIGYATVYRTLKMLTAAGVAHERQFGDGFTRYELADDEQSHHDHLICIDCGRIIEFEEPAIESLQERVAARFGLRVEYHKHELYCACTRPDCPYRKVPPDDTTSGGPDSK